MILNNKNAGRVLCGALVLAMAFSLTACGKKKEEASSENEIIQHISFIGDTNENTIKVSPNGIITEISVEDYSGTEIDTSSIENYVNSEIDKYNKDKGENEITLLEIDAQQSVVKTAIQYNDITAYNEFNGYDVTLAAYNKDEPDKIAQKEAAEIASSNDALPDFVEDDLANISEEELAAAGYTLDDLERLEETLKEERGEKTSSSDNASVTDAVATFTNASGQNVVESNQITGDTMMMLITDMDAKFIFNGGTVYYTNKHAELADENSARSLGDGKAVIVFDFGM